MRTMGRAAVLTAAPGLAVTGNMSSYATETEAAATSVSYDMKNLPDGQRVDSTIISYIQITSISVKVSITSNFDIDPNRGVTASADTTAQVGQQVGNYMTTNLSIVPLDTSTTKVESSAGVTLVDTVNDLSVDKSVLFAIHEVNEAVPKLLGAENNAVWMNKAGIAGGAPYYAKGSSTYTIQAIDDTVDGGGDILKMKVYVAIKKSWKSGNGFIIAPAFAVSLIIDVPTS